MSRMFKGQILERLSKLQKELLIGAIHSTAAVLDYLALRRAGYRVVDIAKMYTGVALAGIAIGTLYFKLVSHLIEKTE